MSRPQFLFGDSAKKKKKAAEAKEADGEFNVNIQGGKNRCGDRDLTMDDFKLKKVLGKGSFGKVSRRFRERARTDDARVVFFVRGRRPRSCS